MMQLKVLLIYGKTLDLRTEQDLQQMHKKIKPIELPYFIWNEALVHLIVRWISQFRMQDL